MNTQPELTNFLRKWRPAFEDFVKSPYRAKQNQRFWEGEGAYRELQRVGALEAVQLIQNNKNSFNGFREMVLRNTCPQLDSYRRSVAMVKDINEQYREVDEFLAKISAAFRRQAKRTREHVPEAKAAFLDFVTVIERQRGILEKHRRQGWRLPRSPRCF